MKRSILCFLFAGATFAWSQTAPASSAQKPDPEAIAAKEPNKVVATINGKPLTAKQAVDLLKLVPDEQRSKIPNLENAVQQLYTVTDLAQKAEGEGLQNRAPYKERLTIDRDQILAQAYVTEAAKQSGAPIGDPKQYYDTHPQEFDRAQISVIVVGFNPPGTPARSGGINRTEQDAHTKADDIEKKLKTGSDFAALARTESDDPNSATRGGDIGSVSAGEQNFPPDLKDAVFNKLQPGQTSEPIRGQSAYFILRLVSRGKVAYDQVKDQITQQLKTDHDRAASQQITDKYKIAVTDPSFFGTSANASASRIPSLAPPGSATTPAQPGARR